MVNANRGKRFGGSLGSGKGFKKRGAGSRGFGGSGNFGGRDGGRPQMYQAVCSECGNDCQVPFRPSGDKPVYCNQCFSGQGGKSFGRAPKRSGGKSFGRSSFGDKKMYDAVCAKCGNDCQVPFRPSGDKPVYCSQCFEKSDRSKSDNVRSQPTGQFNDQFAVLNSKLDKILKALNSVPTVKAASVKKVAKKTTAAKPVKKKVVKKKKKK